GCYAAQSHQAGRLQQTYLLLENGQAGCDLLRPRAAIAHRSALQDMSEIGGSVILNASRLQHDFQKFAWPALEGATRAVINASRRLADEHPTYLLLQAFSEHDTATHLVQATSLAGFRVVM